MAIFNLSVKKKKAKTKKYYPIQISNIEKLNSKAVSVELDIPTTLKSKFQFEPGHKTSSLRLMMRNIEGHIPFVVTLMKICVLL